MKRAGKELLARAGLREEEDWQVGRREAGGVLLRGEDAGVLGEHGVERRVGGPAARQRRAARAPDHAALRVEMNEHREGPARVTGEGIEPHVSGANPPRPSAARTAALAMLTAPVASTSSAGPRERSTSRSMAASAPRPVCANATLRSARSSDVPAVSTSMPTAGSCMAMGPVTSSTATIDPYASMMGFA